MTTAKVKELVIEIPSSWNLTGEEQANLKHDFEPLPESKGMPEGSTYCEEWDVTDSNGNHLGCLYDDGSGYDYAHGREAGYLDY